MYLACVCFPLLAYVLCIRAWQSTCYSLPFVILHGWRGCRTPQDELLCFLLIIALMSFSSLLSRFFYLHFCLVPSFLLSGFKNLIFCPSFSFLLFILCLHLFQYLCPSAWWWCSQSSSLTCCIALCVCRVSGCRSVFVLYSIEFKCLYSAPQQPWAKRGVFGSISSKKRDKF